MVLSVNFYCDLIESNGSIYFDDVPFFQNYQVAMALGHNRFVPKYLRLSVLATLDVNILAQQVYSPQLLLVMANK